MKLQDFYNLGFKETYCDDKHSIRRMVLTTDNHYSEIKEFINTLDYDNDVYNKVKKFVESFNYYLVSISYVDNILYSCNCYLDDINGKRVILKLEDLKLEFYCDKESELIYRIYDWYEYFSPCGLTYSIHEVYELSNYKDSNISVEEFILSLLKQREVDSKSVKGYYNNELKMLHKRYRDRLKKM